MKTYSLKKADPVKALILERQVYENKLDCELARVIGVSPRTFSRMMHERHTDEWPLKYIRKLCWVLNVTQEQFAASLTNARR